MKIRALFFIAVIALTLSPLRASAEEEELAPGYNACIDKSESTADTIDCIGKAYEHWDKKINQNFKKAEGACAESENPQDCKKALVKAQRLWVQYKEAMPTVIEYLNGGGSMSRVTANYFMAEETKKQAQLLDSGE